MALAFSDRLLTIAATATLVSAGWIVFGSLWLGIDPRPAGEEAAAPVPVPAEEPTSAAAAFREPAGEAASEAAQASPPERARTARLMIPVLDVSAAELIDNFADRRDTGGRLHEAIDIMAPEGTSVVAAAPGIIERLFQSEVGGNTIYIRSNDRRTIHYYAHLHEYAPGLREGQRVRRGQRLGSVGSTGRSDPEAPHLHFAILLTTPRAEWWEPATAVNPYRLLVGE